MSRKEEKWIKRLEILGASAAAIVIVSAVGTFLLDSIAMQLMALAVGCGSIVNVVLMVLCYYKKKTVPSIIFMIFALLFLSYSIVLQPEYRPPGLNLDYIYTTDYIIKHGEDSVYTLYIEDEPEMIFMSVEEIEHLGLHYDAQNDEK